ncbi:MAG: tRNA(His) guanylyltransferase Thg1 family protein [Armatimonadota bacterium]
MNSKDPLGDRMKADYESRTRYYLPRRTYTLIRVDGKAFHQYTKGCERPYDLGLMEDMDAAAVALCQNIEGARLAFVQSDEISVLLTDFANPQSEAWFDGSLQKICSLSASIATAYFNQARSVRDNSAVSTALFDSRVWTIPQAIEVYNYFLWRQQDASRNSLSMTAQAHFPHERLQGLGNAEMQELLWSEKQINWNDLPAGFKRGRVVERVAVSKSVEYVDKRTGAEKRQENVTRHEWRVTEPPVFSQEKEWLMGRIPLHFSDSDVLARG